MEGLEQRHGSASNIRRLSTPDHPGDLDRLIHLERVDRHLSLGQVGAEPACRRRAVDEIVGAEGDAASRRLEQSHDLFDERRFPGAIWPQEAVDLSWPNLESDAVVYRVGPV